MRQGGRCQLGSNTEKYMLELGLCVARSSLSACANRVMIAYVYDHCNQRRGGRIGWCCGKKSFQQPLLLSWRPVRHAVAEGNKRQKNEQGNAHGRDGRSVS